MGSNGPTKSPFLPDEQPVSGRPSHHGEAGPNSTRVNSPRTARSARVGSDQVSVGERLPMRPPGLPPATLLAGAPPGQVITPSVTTVPSNAPVRSTATHVNSSQIRNPAQPSVSPPSQGSAQHLGRVLPPQASARASNPHAGGGNAPGRSHARSLSSPVAATPVLPVLPSFETLLSSLPRTSRSPAPEDPEQGPRDATANPRYLVEPLARHRQRLAMLARSGHDAPPQPTGTTSNTRRAAIPVFSSPIIRNASPHSEMEVAYVDGDFIHMRHPDQRPHGVGAAPPHAVGANAQPSSSHVPAAPVPAGPFPLGGELPATECNYPGCGWLFVGRNHKVRAALHFTSEHVTLEDFLQQAPNRFLTEKVVTRVR